MTLGVGIFSKKGFSIVFGAFFAWSINKCFFRPGEEFLLGGFISEMDYEEATGSIFLLGGFISEMDFEEAAGSLFQKHNLQVSFLRRYKKKRLLML